MSKRTEPRWGKRTPAQRGRWGVFLVRQRFQHGELTQDNVLDMLEKMGSPMSGAYYSDMENGYAPVNEQWQAVFKRLWDAEPDPEPLPEPPATDLAALIASNAAIVAAVERQALAIADLAAAIRDSRALTPQEGYDLTASLAAAIGRAMGGMAVVPQQPASPESDEQPASDAPRMDTSTNDAPSGGRGPR